MVCLSIDGAIFIALYSRMKARLPVCTRWWQIKYIRIVGLRLNLDPTFNAISSCGEMFLNRVADSEIDSSTLIYASYDTFMSFVLH